MSVTQQKIAELAGVSRATVDRVLKNRGRVKPDVAERIRSIAEQLDYRPNRAGIMLVRSNRPLKIGIVLQSIETPFIQGLLKNIEAVRQQFSEEGIALLVEQNIGSDCDQQLASINALMDQHIDGLAITAVIDERIRQKIIALSEQKIPVITFNTDIPSSPRLCYVGEDSYQSGCACAGLMNILLGGKGNVLMITGHINSFSTQQRTEGFRREINMIAPGIHLLPVECCNNSSDIAYDLTQKRLQSNVKIDGIYCASSGQSGICRALQDFNKSGCIHFICHDLVEENIRNVRNGCIDFLIDQDANTQAYLPIRMLADYILCGMSPDQEFYLTQIRILNRYNLPG